MTTKLTLSVDEEVINAAKIYAKKQGKSLSGLVENYFRSLTGEQSEALVLSTKVRSLKGVISLPEDFDYKKELGRSIRKKFDR